MALWRRLFKGIKMKKLIVGFAALTMIVGIGLSAQVQAGDAQHVAKVGSVAPEGFCGQSG